MTLDLVEPIPYLAFVLIVSMKCGHLTLFKIFITLFFIVCLCMPQYMCMSEDNLHELVHHIHRLHPKYQTQYQVPFPPETSCQPHPNIFLIIVF